MALKLPPKSGTADSSTTHTQSGQTVAEDTEQETVEKPDTLKEKEQSGPGVLCEIGFEASYTHNLGNYCSARVQVSLKLPCLYSDLEEGYGFAEEWVNAKILKLSQEVTEQN